MKKTKFSESKIFKILKEAEPGVPVPDLCRQYGFSNSSLYNWRSKYGGMDVSSMRRLKELEEENRRLNKMYADTNGRITISTGWRYR